MLKVLDKLSFVFGINQRKIQIRMDYNLFKVVGVVAGIGGIALASVVYIFREVIRKEIFPQLTKDQAYNLLNRIIVLTFVIGALGILAYLVVAGINRGNNVNQNINEGQTLTPTPVIAEMSGTVLDHNDKPIQGAKVTLDDFPRMQPVETSSDGIFTLKEIPKKYGEGVRIRVIKEDYQPNPYTEDVVLGKAPPRIKLTRKK
jgi:hypothetical protein